MSEKKQFKLSDALIMEALKLEINSVECPPKDRAWRRINAKLQQKAKKRGRLSIPWQRYAVVAAACLIIVISSFAYMNDGRFRQPFADQVQLFEAADSPLILEAENDQEQYYGRATDMAKSVVDLLYSYASPDPAPPDWLPVLADEFVLTDMLLLAKENYLFNGAVYHGTEASLLLVKPLDEEVELTLFVQNLGNLFAMTTSFITAENGLLHFALNGNPGLAWENGAGMQVLLVTSGFIDDDTLRQIAKDISN